MRRTSSSEQVPLLISIKQTSPSVPPCPAPNEKAVHIVHLASRSSSAVGSTTIRAAAVPFMSASSVSSESTCWSVIATATAQTMPFIFNAESMSAHEAALMTAAFSVTLPASRSCSSAESASSASPVCCVVNERKGLENFVDGKASVCSVSCTSERG